MVQQLAYPYKDLPDTLMKWILLNTERKLPAAETLAIFSLLTQQPWWIAIYNNKVIIIVSQSVSLGCPRAVC